MCEWNSKLSILFHELENDCKYEIISSLLQDNKNLVFQLNYEDKRNTALHTAVNNRSCHVHVIQLLIRCEADVSATNSVLETPLHIALNQLDYNFEIIHELINCGTVLDAQDYLGHTPFLKALGNPKSDLRLIKALVKEGSNVNIASYSKIYPLNLLLNNQDCSIHIVKLLLDYGAIFSKNATSYSDILLQYVKKPIILRLDIIKELISRGIAECSDEFFCNSNWTGGIRLPGLNFFNNSNSYTILHAIVMSLGYYDILFYLLNTFNLDVNVQDFMKKTPLHLVISHADADVRTVNLLVTHGAKVDIPDCDRRQPLHYALYTDCLPNIIVLQILLDAGASVSTTDVYGISPLGLAMNNYLKDEKFREIVKLLLKYAIKYRFKIDENWRCNYFQNVLCLSLCPDIKRCDCYSDFYDCIKNYRQELVMIKACILLPKFSLFDLLAGCKQSVGDTVVRQVLKIFINKDFPFYKHCIAESLPRSELYKVIHSLQIYSSCDSFTNKELKVVLNYLCVDNILMYLNNEDLFNFCIAYYISTN